MSFLLALDQGTSSSRSIVFDREGRMLAVAQRELRQIYPRPGWVEHDPEEIWSQQLATAREVLRTAGLKATDIAAVASAIFHRFETCTSMEARVRRRAARRLPAGAPTSPS